MNKLICFSAVTLTAVQSQTRIRCVSERGRFSDGRRSEQFRAIIGYECVPEFETKILRIIQAKLQSQLINKEDTLRKSEDKPQIETRRLVANEVWTLVHYGKMVAAFAAFSFMFLLQKCRPDDIL